MTTFSELLSKMEMAQDDAALVFATETGEIGAGYHITELRLSQNTGIDCGGVVESWEDARLQVLDGQAGTHMKLGKFRAIVAHSLDAVPGLRNAPLMVEFGHQNENLQLMSIVGVERRATGVLVQLGAAHATCKPMKRRSEAAKSLPSETCCGSTKRAATRCCA